MVLLYGLHERSSLAVALVILHECFRATPRLVVLVGMGLLPFSFPSSRVTCQLAGGSCLRSDVKEGNAQAFRSTFLGTSERLE